MANTLGQLAFTGKVVGTTKANGHMPATTFSGKVTTSGGLNSPGNVTTSGTLFVKNGTTLKGTVEAKGAVGVDGVLSAKNEVMGFVPFTTYAGAADVEYESRSQPESSWLDTSSASIGSFTLDQKAVNGNQLVLTAVDEASAHVGTWRWVERYQTSAGGSGSGTPTVVSVSVSKSHDAFGNVYGRIVLNGKRLFWNDREIVVGEGGVLKLA